MVDVSARFSRRFILASLALAPVLARAADSPTSWALEAVASETDGARIVYQLAGQGPPLVIVHGGSTTATPYRAVGERLARHFQVALIERRNYTVSATTGAPHTFEQEVGDVAAVIKQLGGRAHLFGHSAGALVSLYVARDRPHILRTVALYEPPLSAGGPSARPLLARLDELLAVGKQDEALAALYQGLVGLSDADAHQLVVARGAVFRPLLSGSRLDIEALISVDPDPAHWSMVKVPTLLLSGDRSVEHPLRDSVAGLAAVLADAQTSTLVGEGHAAYASAPDLLAGALDSFFMASKA